MAGPVETCSADGGFPAPCRPPATPPRCRNGFSPADFLTAADNPAPSAKARFVSARPQPTPAASILPTNGFSLPRTPGSHRRGKSNRSRRAWNGNSPREISSRAFANGFRRALAQFTAPQMLRLRFAGNLIFEPFEEVHKPRIEHKLRTETTVFRSVCCFFLADCGC